jgi:D-3-phosphoglycerate dehydrogenase
VHIVVIGDVFVPGHLFERELAASIDLSDHTLDVYDWDVEGGPAALHALQHTMEFDGVDSVLLPHDLAAAAQSADILIVHFAPVGQQIISGADHLKAIFVARAGTENVSTQYVGVEVQAIAGRNALAVAELTLGLIMAEMRNIARADLSIRQGGWRKQFPALPRELSGATVGMIGYGQVGRCFTKLLTGFGTTVLAYDPYVSAETLQAEGVTSVSFDEIFAQSDVVTVFARLTPENERFVGRDQFSRMKPGSYFINTSRSRLVDYDALQTALGDGTLSGAGLDVFDEEPLAVASDWRTIDNVTRTSHFAGDTPASLERSASLVAAKVSEFFTRQGFAGLASGAQ